MNDYFLNFTEMPLMNRNAPLTGPSYGGSAAYIAKAGHV